MRRKSGCVIGTVLVLGLSAAAAWAGPPEAPTTAPSRTASRRGLDLPLAGVITNPDWISKPDGDDFERLFPPLASFLGLEGSALLACRVSTTGAVEDCKVTNEIPLGIGFGRAALQMTPSFRMKPMSLDGAPVGGAQVQLPIRFKLGEEFNVPGAVDAAAKPVSPPALALAKRILAAGQNRAFLNTRAEAQLSQFMEADNALGGVTHVNEREAAFQAFREAYAAALPSFWDQTARAYASELTGTELEQVAAFQESPAGQAFARASEKVSIDIAKENARIVALIRFDAARRFCQRVACVDSKPLQTQGAGAPPRPPTRLTTAQGAAPAH